MYNPWPQILPRFRREHRLTQEGAAEAACVSRLTWHRWETGKQVPNPCQLEDLASGLRLSEDELGYMYATAVRYHYAGLLMTAVSKDRGIADLEALETMAGVPSSEDVETTEPSATNSELFAVMAGMASSAQFDEARSALGMIHSFFDALSSATPGGDKVTAHSRVERARRRQGLARIDK